MDPPRTASTDGTQSTRRAFALLKLVGAHHRHGVSFSDVAKAAGMERSTVHRLLGALTDENLLERDPQSKLYRLGVQTLLLGLAANERPPLVDAMKERLEALARTTGDTVLLMVRHYDEVLCVDRVEGAFPIRALTTDIGQRRLLGVGASGLAVLAALPDDEIHGLYARQREAYGAWGISADALLASVQATREAGYAQVLDRVTSGSTGIGVHVPALGVSVSISIVAINSRMAPARRAELGAVLVDTFSAALSSVSR